MIRRFSKSVIPRGDFSFLVESEVKIEKKDRSFATNQKLKLLLKTPPLISTYVLSHRSLN